MIHLNSLKRTITTLTALFLGAMPLFSFTPAYAASASVSLSPASGSYSNGSTLVVTVRENSGAEPVNAASISLSYPADKLTFLSNTGTSAFPVVAASSGGNGSVRYDAGRTPPPVTGSQSIVSVSFRVKVSTGTASISITAASVISANSNQNIASPGGGGTYTLTAAPVAPPAAPKDTVAPQITNVKATKVSFGSAVITWTTSEPATSVVDYGTSKGYGLVASDGNLVTDHKLTLSSSVIQPDKLYHFMVKSADAAGNTVSGEDGTFTTLGAKVLVTVVNKQNKPLSGAKVSLLDSSAVTDKKGQATVSGPIEKQTIVVNYRGSEYTKTVTLAQPDANNTPQPVKVQIDAKDNLLIPILIVLAILLAGAWFIRKHPNPPSFPKLPKLPFFGGGAQSGGPPAGPTTPSAPPAVKAEIIRPDGGTNGQTGR